MKKLYLICFFLVGTTSANEEIWEPSSFYLFCNNGKEIVGGYRKEELLIDEFYAFYNKPEDMMLKVQLKKSKDGNLISYTDNLYDRTSSSASSHVFKLKEIIEQSPWTDGLQEKNPRGKKNERVYIDRQSLAWNKMSEVLTYEVQKRHQCSIITKDEFEEGITDIRDEAGILLSEWIRQKKSKTKI